MKAVIIGGGIIGLSSAYYLSKRGWSVTVIDKSELSESCSNGNLGMIVPSHFIPLAAPGIVAQGIRWMFNSKSPFYVKPSLSAELISWGLKFVRSAREKNVKEAGPHLKELNLFSKKLYEDIAAEPGFGFSYEKKGIMMYYKTDHVASEEIHTAEIAQKMGLDVEVLSASEARQIEPGIELDVLGAVHYRCDAHLYPNRLIQQLVTYLKTAGVTFYTGKPVTGIRKNHYGIEAVYLGEQEIKGDIFVAAAGSWLPEVLRMAGTNIPLMPGKGYSFTHQQPKQQLQVPAILCEARVAITPMAGQLRFGGTMEIGPINSKVNMKRVQGIVEAIPSYFPGMNISMPAKEEVWYGFRPCSPDGLPYIGFASQYTNLLIAGGHAMMGLSLGPATGKLIAELAENASPSLDITAFNPSRFG